MITHVELRIKVSRIILSQYKNPLKKILSLILLHLRWWPFDLHYKTFSRASFNVAVKYFKDFIESHNLHYEYEFFDCEDFALLFKAITAAKLNTNAVGIAIGLLRKDGKLLGGHAWNIVLIDNELYYFEPQTYELFDVKTATTSDGFKYELQGVIW